MRVPFSNLLYAQYEMNVVYFSRNVLFCFHSFVSISLSLTGYDDDDDDDADDNDVDDDDDDDNNIV